MGNKATEATKRRRLRQRERQAYERRAYDPGLRAWVRAIRTPCEVHAAAPGEPCWPSVSAMCGARLCAAGFRKAS